MDVVVLPKQKIDRIGSTVDAGHRAKPLKQPGNPPDINIKIRL